MNSFISRLPALLVLVLACGGLFQPAQAQLQKIQQTVFGMDCAPCAHAMEQSLGSMEGVETVSVSLNDGLATVDLAKANRIDYRGVRKTVENGGFSPREATLKVQGTARQEEGQWILKTPTGEEYALQPGQEGASNEQGLQDLKPNQQVTVTGQIPASPSTEDALWPLRVQQVRSAT
jgi:copper chaperone CopZ